LTDESKFSAEVLNSFASQLYCVEHTFDVNGAVAEFKIICLKLVSQSDLFARLPQPQRFLDALNLYCLLKLIGR
jgi:hypothetical protein